MTQVVSTRQAVTEDAGQDVNEEWLRGLPKAELHLHLEGAIRADTARELAEASGHNWPDVHTFADLADFVQAYESARQLVRSLDDLRRIGAELIQDADRQGVRWTEVHLIPPTYAGRLGAPEGIIEAVLEGFVAGGSATAGAGLVLGVNRGLPPAAAEESLRLALAYADQGVVAFGLAGDEANHPAGAFAELFARARHCGLRAVPHAGEAAGAESVRDCVELLRADRVCHGIRAVEDPALVEVLLDRQVCLDVAPTSNVALNAAHSWREHPARHLLAVGVPITLNSDCPLFFRSPVNEEYLKASLNWGLSRVDLTHLAETSLRVSSCPAHLLDQP